MFHRVSYKLEQNVCVLPLLLACFVALWLPYKYFLFSLCFFLLWSRCQLIAGRYLLLFVLMTILVPLFFVLFFMFELSHSVITNFVFLTRISFPLNPFNEGVLACLRLCECEYFFINLMHFFCFNLQKCVCAFKWAWKWRWMWEWLCVCVCDSYGNYLTANFFFVYTLNVAVNSKARNLTIQTHYKLHVTKQLENQNV